MLDGIVYVGASHVYYELYFSIDVLVSLRLKSHSKIAVRMQYLDFEDCYA